jgi:uncharacterized protein YwgA
MGYKIVTEVKEGKFSSVVEKDFTFLGITVKGNTTVKGDINEMLEQIANLIEGDDKGLEKIVKDLGIKVELVKRVMSAIETLDKKESKI